MPNPPPPYVNILFANVAQVTEEALQVVKTPDDLGQLTEGINSFTSDLLDDLTAQQPPPQTIDCAQGCWYCCISKRVEALPIEVLCIAHYLSPQTAISLSPKADHSCPMLVEASCSIYPVRPFVCRSFNAYDQKICKAKKIDGQDVPILGYIHQGFTYQAALAGLAQACRNKGLNAELVNLPSALTIALKDVKACTRRWLEGDNVFDGCSHADGD